MQKKFVIIGAGPTGLGAAWRLAELGETDFLVLERQAYAGGLSASYKDEAGFTWDLGGHVVFSHYQYFDALLDSLLGDDQLWHERIASVRMAGGWVPYPFQNNIRHLPPEMAWRCVEGLLPGRRPEQTPESFRDWILSIFGQGVADLFMFPYNFKVWATPAELMSWQWIGERVSVVDLERVIKNIVMQQDDVNWGPNNKFRFPLHGGTGNIYLRLAARLPDHILYNQEVVAIDTAAKTLRTADGQVIQYEHLLSTGPLDQLVQEWLPSAVATAGTAGAAGTTGTGGVPDGLDELITASKALCRNGVVVSGIGVDAHRDDPTCWMYFPEDNCPFYRVTNFHNYSPNNVPIQEGKTYRGLMCETSFSEHKPETVGAITGHAVQGVVNTTLVEDDAQVVSRWEIVLPYGYPVPTLGRDRALATIQPWLEARQIYSRGRFGGWRYEMANMDHSVMQGVEWAERMVQGKEESTYRIPECS